MQKGHEKLPAPKRPQALGPLRAILLSILLLAGAIPADGAVQVDNEGLLSLYGDFRLRMEQDWDSRRADGSPREDRLRARVRTRLGLEWEVTDALRFAVRLRSGAEGSHQSPHITVLDFDNNDTGDADFHLDLWNLEARGKHLWGWAGRNGLPFWKQNEMFWDDDVTPLGLAGGWSIGEVSLRAAHLALPVGMTSFSGTLSAFQVVYERERASPAWTLAAGFYAFNADADDPDGARLRSGNGRRDYAITVVSGQLRLDAAGRPLVLGVDLLDNSATYGVDDAFARAHRDETGGFVLSAIWGSAAKRGDWALGYLFGRLEALAVNASYAQDDWVRWGSATETDSSDLRGHELRLVYGLGRAGNLVARLYLVEAISSTQDGKRFRLDYNVKF